MPARDRPSQAARQGVAPPDSASDRPVPVLRGRLTFLRPAERDDIPRFVAWLSDERTVRFLGQRAPIGLAMEEQWFDRMLARHGTDAWFFTICRLDNDRPIGTLGLFAVDLTAGGAGIGILIGDPADRGKGYGTDALEALLDFGFGSLRLERMWLDVYEYNEPGRQSYAKAGFAVEGTQRHAYHRDGRWVDAIRMAILRREWAARRAASPLRPPTNRPAER